MNSPGAYEDLGFFNGDAQVVRVQGFVRLFVLFGFSLFIGDGGDFVLRTCGSTLRVGR